MTSTLVDSNVLIDVLGASGGWTEWSMRAIAQSKSIGRTIINPVIYAEVATAYQRMDEVETGLPSALYDREPLPWEAAFLAGRAHLRYRRAGGSRDRTLPDFLIGAHAAVKGYILLTRDARRYRQYFPDLDIIAPDSHP